MKDNRILKFLIASLIIAFILTGIASAMTVTIVATPTSGTRPLEVAFSFTNTTDGGPINSYDWDFGDGNTSTALAPTHTFSAANTYTVTLTVTHNSTDETSDTQTITVSNPTPPVAAFSYSPTTVYEDMEVTFSDLSTNSPTGWSWNFGDLYSSGYQNPTHTYTAAGNFTVTLIATNADGSNTTQSIIQVISTSSFPVVTTSANITSGAAPLVVKFTGNVTNAPTTYLWQFGDGYTAATLNATHSYSTVGTYKANLTATNAMGSTTSASSTITVSTGTLPVASFYANVTSGSPPMVVKFYDTSTNSPVSWHWVFGTLTGVNTSSEQNPTFTYSTAGYYNVTLTAYNSAGNDVEEKVNYIYVGTAATTATTATPTPTPTPTATAVLPQMTAAFTPATVEPTVTPTSTAFYDGILTETLRINSVIEELVKLFKNMIGLGNSAAS